MDTKLFEAIEIVREVEAYAADLEASISELSRHPKAAEKLAAELRLASTNVADRWNSIEQMPEFRAKYKPTCTGRFDAQQDFHTELARRNEVD